MFSNDLPSANVSKREGLLLPFLWRTGQRLFDGAFVSLKRISWDLVLLPSLPTIEEGVLTSTTTMDIRSLLFGDDFSDR